MKQQLAHYLSNFLQHNLKADSPFLLALSGGTDSLALFYLLCLTKKRYPFAVAHINHRWREESTKEAFALKKLVEAEGIPFHLNELNPDCFEGNLEAYCREQRIKFFVEICQNYRYQGVITAHHADDRAESTLKKLLEGSPFIYLNSLQNYYQFYNIPFWRPLLPFSKQEISAWSKQNGLTPFNDPTNDDCYYMRARFRHQIIPLLAETYGKQINSSLIRMAEESKELKEYADYIYQKNQDRVRSGPFGAYLDLSTLVAHPIWEIKAVAHAFLHQQEISLSQVLFKQLIELILENKAAKQIISNHRKIFIDRRRIFIKKMQEDSALINLGQWKMTRQDLPEARPLFTTNWENAWQGQIRAILPGQPFILGELSTTLSKWLGNAKVPSCLWKDAPVLYFEGGVYLEFLTGRIHPRLKELKGEVEICFDWSEHPARC